MGEEARTTVEGLACRPNISPAGVRRRRRYGVAAAVAAVAMAAFAIATHARWPWSVGELGVAALAAVNLLQAQRRTCVARAAEDTVEHDDFSKTPAEPEDARRSRVVAAGITRDSLCIGLAAAAATFVASRFW